MDEEKKFFGMTRMQIGIIAGLAGTLFVTACIGGILIFRGGSLGFGGSSEPTAIPTVTSVMVTPPTLTPTITLTPVPYEQLVPADWRQYNTPLIEIWLPSNFRTATASDITNGFAFTELLFVEVSSKSSAYNMQVAVTYDLMTADSLDSYLESKFPHLPYQARVTDKRTVFVNTVESRRIVIEYRANNIDYNDLVYVFLDGSAVWYVQYVAEISEFFNNLGVFEQSINTFRIAR